MLENCHFFPTHILWHCSLLMEDIDIFNLFYHILDTKHLTCKVSLESNKTKLPIYAYTLKIGVLSHKNYLKMRGPFVKTSCIFCIKIS